VHSRIHAAPSDEELVPGKRVFPARDELTGAGFPIEKAEAMLTIFPAGSAMATAFEQLIQKLEDLEETQEKNAAELREKQEDLGKKQEQLQQLVGLLVLVVLALDAGNAQGF
jgi:DNA-binding transcriptional MerR regulator